jgi:UDP-N-acetylglucosamine---dolichyl-phosphate N-acetylglucosaminyltransferase
LSFQSNQYKIIAVIPAYNEQNNVVSVVEGVKKYIAEVIVVNDCSKDNTSKAARSTGVNVIDLPENRGAGYATRIGCEKAIKHGADIIVTLDADGQHCPDDIPGLISEMIEKKADIVFGFRLKDKSMPLVKKMGNYLLTWMHLLLFDIRLKDALTGFHVFRATSFDQIRWESDRYGFITEFAYIIYKNKLTFGEAQVKTIYLDKEKGMTIKDGMKSILLLLIWRFNLPSRLKEILNLK